MILDAIRHTTTCAVCGYARGVRLACSCRGWVAFWRQFLVRNGSTS